MRGSDQQLGESPAPEENYIRRNLTRSYVQSGAHALAIALFALQAYFICADIIRHWLPLPAPGNSISVPLFTLFSLVHASAMLGKRRALLFFILAGAISYIAEEVGVRTGVVFGRYHYGSQLGFRLDQVPVLIPLAWFMMIYPSWIVAQALLCGSNLRGAGGVVALAAIAALAMTGWDMVMDPPMAAHGVWTWQDGGPYFSVPLRNYVGWLSTTFLIYLSFSVLEKRMQSRSRVQVYTFNGLFSVLPIIIYVLMAATYLTPGRVPALIVIAVFSMLAPGLLALIRVSLPNVVEVQRGVDGLDIQEAVL